MEYIKEGSRIVMRLDPGDEVFSSVVKVGRENGITLASVSGIGAVGSMTVGVYDVEKQGYFSNTFTGALEIVSLFGDISQMDGETYAHLHMSAGDETGKVFGGHLNEATVSVTAEIFIDIMNVKTDRKKNPVTGMNELKFI